MIRRDIDKNIILDSNVIPEILNSTSLHLLPKTSFWNENAQVFKHFFLNVSAEIRKF